MARIWTARVKAEVTLPVVRSGGREFPRGVAGVIRENEPGWAEMVACPLLDVQEVVAPEAPRRRRRATQQEAADAEIG